MRAREADVEGYVEHGGVKIHYEVHGTGSPTLLLLPTWTLIHRRFWKPQLAYLARHFRVVTYDGPGNGRSARPLDPAAYFHDTQCAYALAVLDATETARACIVSLSKGSYWTLALAAEHPERVLGCVFIAPSLDLADQAGARERGETGTDAPTPTLPPSAVPLGGSDPPRHWAKHDLRYMRDHHEDYLWFFFGQCFPEAHSTKQIEDCVSWGLDTTPDVLAAEQAGEKAPDRSELEQACGRVRCPVLVIHGDHDHVSPLRRAERLAALTRGQLLVLEGGGHLPAARDPVAVNLAIRRFVARLGPAPAGHLRWRRATGRSKRVLYLSSPIGLGHARRDLAIAQELRRHHPDVEVEWLAQHPVTAVLERAGETIHPASRWLANESSHIEAEAGEHDLHCFQALREMDEILVANFMLFDEVTTERDYDLVVGDEAWDVDYFLHENPELKRFAYAWFTDFVGMLPMPGSGRWPPSGSVDADVREALVASDVNAQMIEHIERFPNVRDRAIFVGNPSDVVPLRFGPDLPEIRSWTRAHYDFPGYVTGFDPAHVEDRESLRAELGYAPDEQVCLVTVGGSGVGVDLLRRTIEALPLARRHVPGLRMVVVTGPRIAADQLPRQDGLEVRSFVPELHRHLAACDLAVVQGGLTTCMELTAARRPFVYVPLRHHFEQNHHVRHRLDRYRAGRRLEYAQADPDHLAGLIAREIGREVHYRPVETDGAARAAALLADLL
ncbi:alpha/beta fold hydrolase [Egicoccus sp. AB-alg6-2]|uniref:alpha/beta fold hydrolase n=1 Tax=Egicoccus sp. AB-alg6-2 TaxID=3242692 RepID=UPI00359DAA1A